MMASYYMLNRPAGIGCQPKNGLVEIEDLDRSIVIPSIGRGAWSKITYNRELTEKEIEQYELTPCEKLY